MSQIKNFKPMYGKGSICSSCLHHKNTHFYKSKENVVICILCNSVCWMNGEIPK